MTIQGQLLQAGDTHVSGTTDADKNEGSHIRSNVVICEQQSGITAASQEKHVEYL